MDNWNVAILVLVSVLVGALIPVLLQLRATLRAAELALTGSVPRLDKALDELHKVAVDAGEVLEGFQSTKSVVAAIAASIGPAILAGVRSYRSVPAASENGADHEQPRRDDVSV